MIRLGCVCLGVWDSCCFRSTGTRSNSSSRHKVVAAVVVRVETTGLRQHGAQLQTKPLKPNFRHNIDITCLPETQTFGATVELEDPSSAPARGKSSLPALSRQARQILVESLCCAYAVRQRQRLNVQGRLRNEVWSLALEGCEDRECRSTSTVGWMQEGAMKQCLWTVRLGPYKLVSMSKLKLSMET